MPLTASKQLSARPFGLPASRLVRWAKKRGVLGPGRRAAQVALAEDMLVAMHRADVGEPSGHGELGLGDICMAGPSKAGPVAEGVTSARVALAARQLSGVVSEKIRLGIERMSVFVFHQVRSRDDRRKAGWLGLRAGRTKPLLRVEGRGAWTGGAGCGESSGFLGSYT